MKMPRNKFQAMAGKAPVEPDADDRKPMPKKKGPKRSLFGKKGGASGGESY